MSITPDDEPTTGPDHAEALLTVEQAAARLGTSVRFVRRLRDERRLPFVKLGKHLRVESADLESYIASCREVARPATAPPLSTTSVSAMPTAGWPRSA